MYINLKLVAGSPPRAALAFMAGGSLVDGSCLVLNTINTSGKLIPSKRNTFVQT